MRPHRNGHRHQRRRGAPGYRRNWRHLTAWPPNPRTERHSDHTNLREHSVELEENERDGDVSAILSACRKMTRPIRHPFNTRRAMYCECHDFGHGHAILTR